MPIETSQSAVAAIVDGPGIRASTQEAPASVGCDARTIRSAEEVLGAGRRELPCRLIKGVRRRGADRRELQRLIASRFVSLSIVFIIMHQDESHAKALLIPEQ